MSDSDVKTIFLADDNPTNLQVLSEILEAEGFRTRASLDGLAMLESLKLQKPDLIILDIHMPKLDGYEICASLKAEPEFMDIPVIFCSALGETFNIVKAFSVGGVDYITKPFRGQEVLARVRTHIELRDKQVMLERTLDYLRSAQEHLIRTEKMTSIGTLVGGIAHEINNPINYIISSLNGFQEDFNDLRRLLDFYREKENDPACCFKEDVRALKEEIQYSRLMDEMRQLLDGVTEGSMKVHEVVKSLKVFLSGDDVEKGRVDIRKEAERAVMMIRHRVDETIRLKVDIQPVPDLVLHSGDLSQVILSLLDNALEAIERKNDRSTEESVLLEVYQETKTDKPPVIIKITDSGAGMSENEQKRIFDPFFTTKEIGRGAGLGLTVCYQIVKNIGGTLEMKSREGEGTEARIVIPA